jgi:hypothetical protein
MEHLNRRCDFTYHILNLYKLRSLILKFGRNSGPLSKNITFIWNLSVHPVWILKCQLAHLLMVINEGK